MQNPPFRSDISYSIQNEDYRTELAVLQHCPPHPARRILMVASSGENALSLLTDSSIGHVDAVDLNPAQIHLCELRRTALAQLTRDDQLRLLGSDPVMIGLTGAADRLALWDDISSALPPATRAFWEARRDHELAFGVQHVGRNDLCMHDIQDALTRAGFAPMQRPLSAHDLGAWQAVYQSLMTAPYIRDLFGLPSEALAARIAGIAGYLATCHFRALQQPNPQHNPFVTTVFANCYATAAGEGGLPAYLQIEGQAVLRDLGYVDRLHLRQGNIIEHMTALAQSGGRFDLISISNIADWMTEEQFGALTRMARDCLTPGGAFLARTATGHSMIQDSMERYLATDTALNQVLADVERGPWFRVIAAGFCR